MTDEEIVALVCAGDKNKFSLIIQRYQDKLLRYIKRLTNQASEDGQDILSEVFLSAYANLNGFNPDKKFSSWIYRIAHNKAIDYFRAHKNIGSLDQDSEELIWNKETLFEDFEIEKENQQLVSDAISKLELKYKEAILLFYFEDKSYEEISDILHVSTSQVGVLLYRAKKQLKKVKATKYF